MIRLVVAPIAHIMVPILQAQEHDHVYPGKVLHLFCFCLLAFCLFSMFWITWSFVVVLRWITMHRWYSDDGLHPQLSRVFTNQEAELTRAVVLHGVRAATHGGCRRFLTNYIGSFSDESSGLDDHFLVSWCTRVVVALLGSNFSGISVWDLL